MKIHVYFQANSIEETQLKGKTVVVIDVLRASTTICSALLNGAKEIIPVLTLETATKIASNLFDGQFLLGGERQGKMIDGFDMGNSPSEYSVEKVDTKSIVFSTTNGTVAIYRSRYAEKVFIGGFVNLSVLCNHLINLEIQELVIVCAGKENYFCIEDSLCAGAIISNLIESKKNETFVLTDAARTSQSIWRELKGNLSDEIRNSDHGKYLTSIGLTDDVELASTIDKYPVLPYLKDGSTLRVWSDNQPKFKKVDMV